ncbi:PQQ-binding-like beta-propeller repeat protein, partial [Steroidobacter sp.]|uniref:outer membrane protein assembly factor BamB family protein n=1 Tax=Steroidobacter sp. TaxID=1978227 RepID=UPI001A4716D5
PGEASVVFPGPAGAHNWHAMSFNPTTGLVYIPSQEIPTLMKVMTPEDTGGGLSAGGATLFDLLYGLHDPKYRDQLYGEVVAWDPVANQARWRARHVLPINGGTISTAGNLVFQGTADGKFIAYDAANGKVLWNWQGDGSIQSAPTTVAVDGEQYILVASGNSASANLSTYTARLTTTEKSRGPSRLLAFKLGGSASLPPSPPLPPFAKPSRPPVAQDIYRRGELFFEFNACVACHGMDAVAANGSVPDLRRMSDATYRSMRDIVVGGAYQTRGMPAHAHLTDDELAAMAGYLTNKAWDAYNEQEQAKAQR